MSYFSFISSKPDLRKNIVNETDQIMETLLSYFSHFRHYFYVNESVTLSICVKALFMPFLFEEHLVTIFEEWTRISMN